MHSLKRTVNEQKKIVCAFLDGIRRRLIQDSKFIHENPELGFHEYKASGRLAEELRTGGFSVEQGIGNMETALMAEHPERRKGPTVALLGEYDALPELGHACGHNLMGVASLGAALALGTIKSELPGTIRFVGTPAEEGGGGKVRLIEAGVFDDLDAAMMFHPGNDTYCDGRSLAMSQVKITFRGRSSHAAAAPENGINALDAVIQTFVALNALRQHIKDGSRIHGIITDGGKEPNIIPDLSQASFCVRAQENDYRDELLNRLRMCAEGAALATGATPYFEVGQSYRAINPNSVLGITFSKNLTALGMSVGRWGGRMASTDMGDVSYKVPTIQPIIKIVRKETPLHSAAFAKASASALAHDVMIKAAKALAMTAIDIVMDAKIMRRIRDEFKGKQMPVK